MGQKNAYKTSETFCFWGFSLPEACGPKPEQPNIVAYTTAYFFYGLYGWIEEWFKRGMQETPKEMAELWEKAQNQSLKEESE